MDQKIFNHLVDQMIDGVLFVDEKNVIRFCNEPGAAIRSTKADKIIDTSVLACHNEESWKKVSTIIKDLKTGKKDIVQRVINYKDRFFEFSYTAVLDDNKKFLGVIAVSRDITKRKLLEQKVDKQTAKLKELSVTDNLTGLNNFGQFYKILHREIVRSLRQNQPLSLILFDIDNFKKLNDDLGHPEGDKLLKKIGRLIKSSIRNEIDSAFRYGGDEFTIILPGSDSKISLHISQRLLAKINLEIKDVTISIGIACVNKQSSFQKVTAKKLIQLSDKAMYEAKKSGGNQVALRHFKNGDASSI